MASERFGGRTVEFAKALVQVTLAYFLKQPLKLAKAQLALIRAIRRRESASRKTDRLRAGKRIGNPITAAFEAPRERGCL